MSYEQFVNPLLWEPSVEECHRTGQVESHSPKAQRYRQGLEVALIPLLEKRQRRIQSRKRVYGVAAWQHSAANWSKISPTVRGTAGSRLSPRKFRSRYTAKTRNMGLKSQKAQPSKVGNRSLPFSIPGSRHKRAQLPAR